MPGAAAETSSAILCIALSPALDVTFHVDQLEIHHTNRVRQTTSRAGGKAVNVARLLHALGLPVRLVLPLGGRTGADIARDLQHSGLVFEAVPVATETRRTVTVVDASVGDATVLAEPARLTEWPRVLDRIRAQMADCAVVVVSGSLPDGAPVEAFAQLVEMAHSLAKPVVIDTSGPALAAALAAGPSAVKPNEAELREVVGLDLDPRLAADRLMQATGSAVVVSLGPDGLLAVTPEGTWRARPGEQLRGNPTGAGDAVVAAMAAGRLAGTDWPGTLVNAVALSGAAVLTPVAGEVDPAHHRALLATVEIRTLGLLEETT